MITITEEFILKDLEENGLSQFYTPEGMWTVYDYHPHANCYDAVLTNGKDKVSIDNITGQISVIVERINKGIR